jgi:predicted DCC family thiol-disulfide oxidoreductase YuxK
MTPPRRELQVLQGEGPAALRAGDSNCPEKPAACSGRPAGDRVQFRRMKANETHWLIWDGDCDFCRAMAERFTRTDRKGLFTVVSYQDAPSPPMTPALRVQAQRSIQLVTNQGQRCEGARAVLAALCIAGWHRRIMRVALRRPFIWIAELGYRFVARNRGRFGRFLATTERAAS